MTSLRASLLLPLDVLLSAVTAGTAASLDAEPMRVVSTAQDADKLLLASVLPQAPD